MICIRREPGAKLDQFPLGGCELVAHPVIVLLQPLRSPFRHDDPEPVTNDYDNEHGEDHSSDYEVRHLHWHSGHVLEGTGPIP